MSDAYRITRDRRGFEFSADAEPVLRVPHGARITFEILDCFSNMITSPEQHFAKEHQLLSIIGRYNPVTGPVCVEGACPGDVLAVSIEEIRLGTAWPFAVTTIFGTGSRYVSADCPGIPPDGATKVCPITGGEEISFPTARGELRLPARPMIGTIGTAPGSGSVSSMLYGSDHGGNMDCPMVTAGSVVYLPVNVPGALLSLGDVHALMGDAEITGTALETSADVTVSVRVLPRGTHHLRLPHIDNDQMLGTVGCLAGAGLERNLEAAMLEMHHRLVSEHGHLAADAYQLVGATARVLVNQCVSPPEWSAVYVGVPRAHAVQAFPPGAGQSRGSRTGT